jgi:phospho-N-acetylmuramoyl-pentapeptide-transferase
MYSLEHFTQGVTTIFALSFLAFCVAMLLTPIYTYFAYKHKLWKQHRTQSTTGEALQVISKMRIKRNVPLMAGLITIASVTIITVLLNLDRQQTWLPLAALLGGGLIGLIDDIINVRGKGGGVAGLRAPIKFAMIAGVAAIGAWFFYYKLGYTTVHIPFVGDWALGWLLIPLFILVVIGQVCAALGIILALTGGLY